MNEQMFVDVLTDSEVVLDGSSYTCRRVDGGGAAQSCTSLFFPGCSFINYDPGLAGELFDDLRERGLVDGVTLLCCGKILAFGEGAPAAKPAFQEELMGGLASHGVERIVAACPNCVAELEALFRAEGSGIAVVPLSEVLAQAGFKVTVEELAARLGEGGRGDATMPVAAVHDACPDRATGRFASSVRALFAPEALVEKAHYQERSFCCGSLANAAGHPDVAQSQALQHGAEACEAHAAALVVYCMSCARFLGTLQDSVPVFHYLELLFNKSIDWENLSTDCELRFLSLSPGAPALP
ncbi:MAG: hypothetical protein LBB46_05325 [Coriobacteriaceae bacterium]|jgi:Fe-S oxidoreductase|nr:hypothetical protein [Coriobacteriaceae bacterium]